MLEFTVVNEAEMIDLGRKIGEQLNSKQHIVLSGELGAGKTTFTKGLAQGLGVLKMIKSPTYTIIREYTDGRFPLYHMDVYRLSAGVDELGLEEYYEQEGICVIEWGQLFPDELPSDYMDIRLSVLPNDRRQIQIGFHGELAKEWGTQFQVGEVDG